MRFERTNHGLSSPRPQNGNDKLRRITLRMDHRRISRHRSFGFLVQLKKRPAASGSQIAQSNFISSFLDNLLPTFVKHLFLLVISHHRFQLQARSQCASRVLILQSQKIFIRELPCPREHQPPKPVGAQQPQTQPGLQRGEIIIHCKNRAQASRREKATSHRRAICCWACGQFNLPQL